MEEGWVRFLLIFHLYNTDIEGNYISVDSISGITNAVMKNYLNFA